MDIIESNVQNKRNYKLICQTTKYNCILAYVKHKLQAASFAVCVSTTVPLLKPTKLKIVAKNRMGSKYSLELHRLL